MEEKRVTFLCDKLTLEGLLAAPDKIEGAGVVCHPHPQYGGSMHNNVVEAALRAMWGFGYATLRFNFRGVGRSEGEFAGGVGEVDDAVAAVKFLASQPRGGKIPMLLAGYSFGAAVALRAGLAIAEVDTIIAIAPAIAMVDLSFIVDANKRIILISGDSDPYCPAAQLRTLHKTLKGPSELKIIKGVDHFFGGAEDELTKAIHDTLAS